MNNSLLSGVDIGGSHITAALVDMHNGKIIAGTLQRRDVDAMGNVEDIIYAWAGAIRDSWKGQQKPASVGIAMPGPFDYSEGISLIKGQYKYEALYGLNIRKLLASALDISASGIVFTNDAAGFLMGEVFAGAAKGYDSVIGITLGTGLGSSLFRQGITTDADLWCSPFEESIAEDYLSTRWFIQRYFELTGSPIKNVKELVSQSNREAVQTVFNEFGNQFGKFLVPVIQREETEMVILGGSISKVYHLFSDGLNAYLQSHGSTVKIRISALGEQAALVGAASACQQESLAE